jgi:fucose permease
MLGGISTGPLIERFGYRIALATGGGAFILAVLYLATRPPFVALVVVQVVIGFAAGTLESTLNAYIAAIPDSTTLLIMCAWPASPARRAWPGWRRSRHCPSPRWCCSGSSSGRSSRPQWQMARQLATPGLVPTGIGVMNAGSIVGASVAPWLAGAIAQGAGPWTLLPSAVVLAVLQLAVWRLIARTVRTPAPVPLERVDE